MAKSKIKSVRQKTTSRIHWRNHFIELIVVIIGIMVAFTINRFYESHKDKEEAVKYLNSFEQSLQNDKANIQQVVEYNKTVSEGIGHLIQGIIKRNVTYDSALIVLSQMSSMQFFNPDLSAYESIKYSGNLNLISDYNLKEKMISYYQQLEANNAQYSFFELHINNHFIPYLYENIDILNEKFLNKNSLYSPDFTNLVSGYLVLLNQNISIYEQLNSDCEQLLNLVQDNLN